MKAHRLAYHSSPGRRVTKKKKPPRREILPRMLDTTAQRKLTMHAPTGKTWARTTSGRRRPSRAATPIALEVALSDPQYIYIHTNHVNTFIYIYKYIHTKIRIYIYIERDMHI